MKLTFLGAARTVTGSCHLVEVNGSRILLDCGLFQGHRKEAYERNRTFAFDPASIDTVVLSHAHIDHAGNLPRLVASGFNGRIVCTSATQDLSEYMLRDAGNIQEKDVEYVNRKRERRGERPFEPLYTVRDAERALEHFEGIPYEHEVVIGHDVRLTFRDAGHILGSATCTLAIGRGPDERRLVFTGDVGRPNRPILRNPVPLDRADWVISESTYGDRLHAPQADVKESLRQVVQRTFDAGGKLLIPAFSVGRTQRLVFHLNELFTEGSLPELPLFVDSPLSADVTRVFRAHPECYDDETMEFLESSQDPFGFGRLTYIRDVAASKALNGLRVPCVIIASSGMCEAGRVLHHLKHVAPDPASTILITGFMAPHTLGRRIAERVPTIKVYGDEFPLRAEVARVEGLSAHADRDELTAFLSAIPERPERIFLVHGDPEPAMAFAKHLESKGMPRVDVPDRGESFEL